MSISLSVGLSRIVGTIFSTVAPYAVNTTVGEVVGVVTVYFFVVPVPVLARGCLSAFWVGCFFGIYL